MSLSMMWVAAAAIAASPAPAQPSPLRAICDLVCGDWGPEAPSDSEPQMKLQLAWDEASGEIHGIKTSTGWDGGAASSVAVSFRAAADGAVWFVVEQPGLGRLESSVALEPDNTIRIIGLVPGKPDLVAVTILTSPAPDRLHEVQAESGQQYNATVFETTYRRETK